MSAQREVYADPGPVKVAARPQAPPAKKSSWKAVFFFVAIAVVLLNRKIAPTPAYDHLNVIPLLAVLYICYCLVTLDKVFPNNKFVQSRNAAGKKPFGSFLVSPWFCSLLLIPLITLGAEFGLRYFSYHRALLYQRQGDLLFTPVPNQKYVEKISLTRSTINDLGLRGAAPDLSSGKNVILALGDSITYGYGVDDDHTYPADLQKVLDTKYPGRYTVLNGGVDAYPIVFEHQKFLYLWNRGVHPNTVLVGYSFNEGGLGNILNQGDQIKDKFASRVRMKNRLRSISLYNIVVENWARQNYNHMKKYMVPGTNFSSMPQGDVNALYTRELNDFVSDLRARNVQPVFILFCGYDGRTGTYEEAGPFQRVFEGFAEKNNVPLLHSKAALLEGLDPKTDLRPMFQDQAHMKPIGTMKVAQSLATFLPTLGKQEEPSTTASK
ncbi:MAG TPA: hypothetical protein VJQ82_23955 [Terriglobales bacterium]|nr:hypothetical protein [Terriglobales bacterium]